MSVITQSICRVCNRILRHPYLVTTSTNIWSSLKQQQKALSMSSTQALNQELKISDACIKQMKKVSSDGEFLRVVVEGGGCSGFQYKFELDTDMQEDDKVFERDGVKVVSDETSLDLINGSTVDYEEELIKSAFRIKDNPKSKTSCSCGVSFDVEL